MTAAERTYGTPIVTGWTRAHYVVVDWMKTAALLGAFAIVIWVIRR